MTLRLVSSTRQPARPSRRVAAKDPVTFRAIDSRPDLYERLRESWVQQRRRSRFAVALFAGLTAAIMISVLLYS